MVLETYRGTHFLRYFSFVIDCKSMSNVTLVRGKLFKKKYSQFYFQQLFRLTLKSIYICWTHLEITCSF